MKKLLSFFCIFAYAVGAIGGIGYACFLHKYFIAICVGMLAILAFPKVKEFYKELTEG